MRLEVGGRISLLDVGGGEPERLTLGESGDFDPSWSVDGAEIVFVSTRDGQLQLYLMDADGGDLRRLSSGAAADLEPHWAPDP